MIVVWTTAATLAYLLVGFFLVPLAIVVLRPLIRMVNTIVSVPAAKDSELTDECHIAVGMRFFTLLTVYLLLWGLAWAVVTHLTVNPWAIWVAAALLSAMNYSNATWKSETLADPAPPGDRSISSRAIWKIRRRRACRGAVTCARGNPTRPPRLR